MSSKSTVGKEERENDDDIEDETLTSFRVWKN